MVSFYAGCRDYFAKEYFACRCPPTEHEIIFSRECITRARSITRDKTKTSKGKKQACHGRLTICKVKTHFFSVKYKLSLTLFVIHDSLCNWLREGKLLAKKEQTFAGSMEEIKTITTTSKMFQMEPKTSLEYVFVIGTRKQSYCVLYNQHFNKRML